MGLFVTVLCLYQLENIKKDNEQIISSYLSEIEKILSYEEEICALEKNNIALTDANLSRMKSRLGTRIYYKTGFPILFTTNGLLLIHPVDESKNVSQVYFGAKIISSNSSEGNFEYISDETNSKKVVYFKLNKQFNVYYALMLEEKEIYEPFYDFVVTSIISSIVLVAIFLFLLSNIAQILKRLSSQCMEVTESIIDNTYNKIFEINGADWEKVNAKFTELYHYLSQINIFTKELADGNLEADLNSNHQNELTQSLKLIRDNTKKTKEIEIKRKIEDEKANWVNMGLAKFGDILRAHSTDIESHCDNIIQNLVKYVNANQGGIFLINAKDDGQGNLQLISAFAFDTKKFLQKEIELGVGLVGTCAVEKQTIYITDIPEDYIEITSGLGEANPRCILICPIKRDEEVLGVIEMASFYNLEQHQILFVEKIMESVASTLASAKINAQTGELIHRFERQSKDMEEKEEEMKQTIEELNSTQEEIEKKEYDYRYYIGILSEFHNLIEYDISGSTLNVNDNFAKLFDRSKKDILNTTIQGHHSLGLAMIPDFDENWEKLCSNEKVEIQSKYFVKGSTLNFHEIYIPMPDVNNRVTKILRIVEQV